MQIKIGDYLERVVPPKHEDHFKIAHCNDEKTYYEYYRILKILNHTIYLLKDPTIRAYPIPLDYRKVQKPYEYHDYSMVSEKYEAIILTDEYLPSNTVSIKQYTKNTRSGYSIHAGTQYIWCNNYIYFPEKAVYYTGQSWEILE